MCRHAGGRAVAWLLLLLCARSLHAHETALLRPPELVERVDAVYPPEALARGEEATVVLAVTVDATGAVSNAEVLQSGGGAFDDAALAAVMQWRFTPAMRGDTPVASRIRVPFEFTLPEFEMPAPAAAPTPSPVHVHPLPPPEVEPAPPPPVLDVQVRGAAPTVTPRAASVFSIRGEALRAAPYQDAGDLLSRAPGIFVARPDGEAKAQELYLRGFNADHGQDIELTVGFIPINQPSHIAGQGYADLNFIIPETVRSLRVIEGVFDPRQGDFAVAGSVDFDLGVVDRGLHAKTTVGSFGRFRQLLLWAPEGMDEETFGAVAIRQGRGFGENRGSMAGTAMGQLALELPLGVKLLGHLAAHGARAASAGVVRRDDVHDGIVGFYESYDDPSATAQSNLSARAQAGLRLQKDVEDLGSFWTSAWTQLTTFHLRQNYTGYLERSITQAEWTGRGDLQEQVNNALSTGFGIHYRTERVRPTSWLSALLEVGAQARTDIIDQQQNLLQAPQNETWDRRVDAQVRGAGTGVYLDVQLQLTRFLRIQGGGRADVLYFDVDDRLGNNGPAFRKQDHLLGFRRTALGLVAGPRATVELRPLEFLPLYVAYGEGYRSPQARQLEEGQNAPYTKVRSFEGGLQLLAPGERLTLTAAGYVTSLSNDLAFDPDDGRVEKIGPTSRRGAVMHVVARPQPWLFSSVSATYVHATLDAPPPASPENPAPAYRPGQLLPYVPPVVIRADMGLNRQLADIRGLPLHGRLAASFTALSPRPLPYRQLSSPVTLVDVSAGLRLRFIELGIDIMNLFNSRYATNEYVFSSDWRTREIPSLIPARHVAAGAPRTVLFHAGVHL